MRRTQSLYKTDPTEVGRTKSEIEERKAAPQHHSRVTESCECRWRYNGPDQALNPGPKSWWVKPTHLWGACMRSSPGEVRVLGPSPTTYAVN